MFYIYVSTKKKYNSVILLFELLLFCYCYKNHVLTGFLNGRSYNANTEGAGLSGTFRSCEELFEQLCKFMDRAA